MNKEPKKDLIKKILKIEKESNLEKEKGLYAIMNFHRLAYGVVQPKNNNINICW